MIPTGTCEVTSGGALECKYIIHAVGPNMNDPSQLGLDRGELLAFAINNTLAAAEELGCRSISIPAISTGSFGFPKAKCAEIMLKCVVNFCLENNETSNLKFIRMVNNDKETVQAFVNEFDNNLLDNCQYL